MSASTAKLPSLAKAPWLNEPRLQKVLAVLNTGGETRIAGGAVRNALLKLPISDVDLATTLVPKDVVQLAKGAGFGVHPTGIEHGTVTVTCRGAAFEVTTLRRDVTTDGRHAVVAFTTNFAEDAQRRDFTINAMMCDRSGKIYDVTNGYADILKRRVRFVGKPAARIAEDYLRILRFFRFHAHYGKGAPDYQGLHACKRLRKGLEKISAERIRQEMMKLLVAPRAVETLQVMAQTRVLAEIIEHVEPWRLLKRLPADAVLRLFVLARDPATLKLRLRLSNAEASRIEAMIAAPDVTPALREKERRAMLYDLGPQAWRDAVQLSWAKSKAKPTDAKWRALLNFPDTWIPPLLPLTGKDLLAAGRKPGPGLGAALRQAEDYWVASDFAPKREELLAWLEANKA